jgi:hypothetical protein
MPNPILYASLWSTELVVSRIEIGAYATVGSDTGWDANGAPIMSDTATKPPVREIKTIWQHLKERSL